MLRRTLPDGCLSSLALDQLVVGQLEPVRREEARVHLVGCARCRAREASLQAERVRFAEQAPRRRRPVPAGRLRPAIAMGVGLLAAAAAVLLMGRPPRDRAGRTLDATRAKGGLRLEVYVKHGDQVLPARGTVLRPGDAIRFAYAGVDGGYIAVLGRDGAGAVSLYYPAADRAAPAARAEEEEEVLPGSIVLDDSPGPETIHLVHCDAPVSVATLTGALDRAGGLRAAGCAVERLILDKRP